VAREHQKQTRSGLTAITIENFKSFGDPVTVPLRPITLLFGANSSGKSTVLQAMQYAGEVLDHRNPDVYRTIHGGDTMDLGGFEALVHKHELNRRISITLHFSGSPEVFPYLLPDLFYSDVYERLFFMEGVPIVTEWLHFQDLAVRVSTGWDGQRKQAFTAAYEVFFNGETFGCIEKAGPTRDARLAINFNHPFFIEAEKGENEYGQMIMEKMAKDYAGIVQRMKIIYESGTAEQQKKIRDMLRAKVKTLERESPRQALTLAKEEPPLPIVRSVIPEWGRSLGLSVGDEMDSVFSQFLSGAGESIRRELKQLRYLGPLREIPSRAYTPSPPPLEPSRWATGLAAWDALLRSAVKPETGPSLVEQCSDYMKDVLDLGYTIRREDHIQIDAKGEIMEELQLLAARYEEKDAAYLAKRVVEPLESVPRSPVIILHDEKNNIDVEAQDIGVGVSQTLPVVVGAVEPNCSIFVVEQPELHVHPAIQVSLGDVFLREALGESGSHRTFLLETHSEHLVLRIMRRMRETSQDRLPSSFPPVTPDQVAVLLVEVVDGKTIIREMPLNERGELVKAWPGGFFEEALQETL